MRWAAAAALVLWAGCASSSGGRFEKARVQTVVDGDTLETTAGVRVRLLSVDAPERDTECYGPEAFAWLRDRLLDRDILLDTDFVKEDDFGRQLAYVYLDGELVNADLLREGIGCILIIAPNNRYESFLRTVEDGARVRGDGLWSLCGGCDTSL